MKILKGLKNPDRAWVYLKWNTLGRFYSWISKFQYHSQYSRVHDDLLKDEKFLLIILDACRFDYFEDHYEDYFEGDLEKVYSSGRNTFEYVSNMWDRDHEDILYMSGAVVVNSIAGEDWGPEGEASYVNNYVPDDHLRISNYWQREWDEELLTVRSEGLVDEIIDKLGIEDKIVAHFYQPHAPYIGDYQIEEVDGSRSLDAEESFERFSSGEITEKEIRKAYRANLIYVMEEVKRLVEEVDDRRVVITSDHGELFGEMGIVGHPKKHHHLLREVPWLELKEG